MPRGKTAKVKKNIGKTANRGAETLRKRLAVALDNQKKLKMQIRAKTTEFKTKLRDIAEQVEAKVHEALQAAQEKKDAAKRKVLALAEEKFEKSYVKKAGSKTKAIKAGRIGKKPGKKAKKTETIETLGEPKKRRGRPPKKVAISEQ